MRAEYLRWWREYYKKILGKEKDYNHNKNNHNEKDHNIKNQKDGHEYYIFREMPNLWEIICSPYE